VSRHLSGGHRYLCGDSFSAADLTFAALSYPLIFPSVVVDSVLGLSLDALPAELQQLCGELRATPAGKHALAIYEQHRWVRGSGDVQCVVYGRNLIVERNADIPMKKKK
jgi:glutathione S-transferase